MFALKARYALINVGKMLPFVMCFIVCMSYVENLYALMSESYLVTPHYTALCKPISFAIAGIFEYDWGVVAVLVIMAYALETCYWNKLTVLYLLLHLIFKNYVQDIVFDETEVYIVSIVNAAISFFLSYKGAEILVKHG